MHRLYAQRTPSLPVEVMGIHFPNPLGLAAGLDKEARCIGPLFDIGFGFLELGTVTPQPQPGNPKPRLFRLTRQAAIINRMGFNSSGLTAFLANLAAQPHRGPIGINIGKNKLTPDTQATDDYLAGLRAVYAHADYVTLNISSPNTPGLRALQDEAPLAALLAALKHEQELLAQSHGRHVPIAVKIAPDLDDAGIDAIARLLLTHRLEAVIATNTTVSRPDLEREPQAREVGGLSGRPLRALSTKVIRRLYTTLQGRIPIIGVGGIGNADDAWEKLVAGADLLQLYTALIYRGPRVVNEIVRGLTEKMRAQHAATFTEAVQRSRKAGTIHQ
jgi:dihydroorotate dehydrogenase